MKIIEIESCFLCPFAHVINLSKIRCKDSDFRLSFNTAFRGVHKKCRLRDYRELESEIERNFYAAAKHIKAMEDVEE